MGTLSRLLHSGRQLVSQDSNLDQQVEDDPDEVKKQVRFLGQVEIRGWVSVGAGVVVHWLAA